MSGENCVERGRATATLTVNLTALAHNWRTLQDVVAPAECAAVVKANAYGIGLAQAVPALAKAGCRTFFVAHVEEGIRARAALGNSSVRQKIYVLNGLLPEADIDADYLANGLAPVLSGADEYSRWLAAGERRGSPLPLDVALHGETGMNRLGMTMEEAADIAMALNSTKPLLKVDLVMSHFISAERPHDKINQEQVEIFSGFTQMFPGIAASLSNSSGIFLPQQPHYDLVRPGYALYGGNPVPGHVNPMLPVVRLDATILQTHWIKPGETVGYNGIWTAQRRSRLATLAVGYGDGFPRGVARADGRVGGGEAMVGGIRCPIVGRVSMDLIVLDVTDAPGYAADVGQSVELLGSNILIDDLARDSGTIGYELLTGLGQRYHRVYETS